MICVHPSGILVSLGKLPDMWTTGHVATLAWLLVGERRAITWGGKGGGFVTFMCKGRGLRGCGGDVGFAPEPRKVF